MACVKPRHVRGRLKVIREEVLGDKVIIIIRLSVKSRNAKLGIIGIKYKVEDVICYRRKEKGRMLCLSIAEVGSGEEVLVLEPTYPHEVGGFFGVTVPMKEFAMLIAAKKKMFKRFFDVGISVSVSVDHATLQYNDGTRSDVIIDFKKPYVTIVLTDSKTKKLGRLDKILLLVKKAVGKLPIKVMKKRIRKKTI